MIGLAFTVLPATAGIVRHDADIADYREIGGGHAFTSVGRYADHETSQDYAAGVLIAPSWILAAAHFVEPGSVWTFGDNIHHTKRIVRHPKLTPDTTEPQWDGWDLALIELDRPVENVKPAVRYRGRDELGKVITKIGYGYIGDGLNGLHSPRVQERLGGHNTVDAIGGTFEGRTFGPDVLACDFDQPDSEAANSFGSPKPLPLEIGGAKGDSGGGAFLEVNGEWQLVGIVSGGLKRDVRYGSIIALARVSSANTWIDSVLADNQPPAQPATRSMPGRRLISKDLSARAVVPPRCAGLHRET